jgi:hypothetical protein
VIASVLDIPPAGAALGLPPSMVTWHLEPEGAVVEMEDDEPAHAVARMASAGITNCRARTASCKRCNQPAEGGTVKLKQPCNSCGRNAAIVVR